jgi:hypothetical protein
MENIATAMWDELSRLPAISAAREMSGYLDVLPRSERGEYILAPCPKLAVARRLLKLWRGLNEEDFNATMSPEDASLEFDRRRGRAVFRIARSVFDALPPRGVPLSGAGRWAWFRGVWGAAGSLYLPRNGYYMVLRVWDRPELGRRIMKTFASAGIGPALRTRGGRAEYIVREQDQIVTCLSKMGLVKSSLILEETAIMRSLKSRANKLVNCDTANIGRAVGAAMGQMALVDFVEARGLEDSLPPALVELIQARKANPDASLRELGQILSKPVSKSTVEYRWKKLASLIRG